MVHTGLVDIRFLIFRDFLVCPKNIENLTSGRTSQHLKNMIRGRPQLDFKVICEPVWHQFSLQFATSRKLIFCNSYNAKCLFLLLKPSHFGIENEFKNYVFARQLPGHPLKTNMLIVCQNDRFGDRFKIQWASTWAHNQPSGANIAPK